MEQAGFAQAAPAYILRKKNARLLKVILVEQWRYELEKKKIVFFKQIQHSPLVQQITILVSLVKYQLIYRNLSSMGHL